MGASAWQQPGPDETARPPGICAGISGIFSGLGTSLPLTTFAQNNGVISLTAVASRQVGGRLVQCLPPGAALAAPFDNGWGEPSLPRPQSGAATPPHHLYTTKVLAARDAPHKKRPLSPSPSSCTASQQCVCLSRAPAPAGRLGLRLLALPVWHHRQGELVLGWAPTGLLLGHGRLSCMDPKLLVKGGRQWGCSSSPGSVPHASLDSLERACHGRCRRQ